MKEFRIARMTDHDNEQTADNGLDIESVPE